MRVMKSSKDISFGHSRTISDDVFKFKDFFVKPVVGFERWLEGL